MDYRGQYLAEHLYYFLTIVAGAVAWVIGWYKNDFQVAFYGWAAGLGIALVLCIPDWPMFNRNKVTWLEEVGQHTSNQGDKRKGSNDDSSSKADKKKNK